MDVEQAPPAPAHPHVHVNGFGSAGNVIDISSVAPLDSDSHDFEEEHFTTDDQVVGSHPPTRPLEGHAMGSLSEHKFRAHLAPIVNLKKERSTWSTLLLAYQTLGVVYGDLGTSPLYVYSSTKLVNPTKEDFLGVMSIMFWTLTFIALIKYVFIVLRADDHGEGGTFALYSKLCQHARVGQTAGRHHSPLQSDAQLKFYGSRSRTRGIHSGVKLFLERTRWEQMALLLLVMTGTSMVIGDGVLTPAISVLSAIVGIQQEKANRTGEDGEAISQNAVVAISAVILLLLFLLQRFGTSKVAFLFSPVMVLWFLSTPIIGVYNIAKFYPGVFKALSPVYIIRFFQNNGKQGWEVLSGIVLVITGAEAMFCDMGHFSKQAIQIAFTTVVYPSLILTYAGQTAYLIAHPSALDKTFFASIPTDVYWPMFLVSTLAAIVASQALISATFSIIKQSVSLGCFPRVQINHTSEKEAGQIYSPGANYILMVLCLAVVLGFRDGTQIGNAFGVAVMFVMAITTCLVTLVMLVIWQTAWPIILFFFIFFISIEGVYISAVLNKVPQGGWVPFAIAAVFLSLMLTWNLGRRKKQAYEAQNKLSSDELQQLLTDSSLQRVPGICFFYSDLLDGPPPVFTHFVNNVRSLRQILVFTTVRFLPVKSVLPSERFLVGRVGGMGVYRCVARYGYKDHVDVTEQGFMAQVIECLEDYLETKQLAARQYAEDLKGDKGKQLLRAIPEELEKLRVAVDQGVVYVIGRAQVKLGRKKAGWFHRFVVNSLFYTLQRNCRSSIADLKIPSPNLLEVGMVYSLE